MSSTPELSVVVPAYREGGRIRDNLKRLISELDQLDIEYEVVVVSDGNDDNTAAESRSLGSPRIRVLEYSANMGKGHALTKGVESSVGDLVTFIDADMELNPREIRTFVALMKESVCDIVVGSKRHPDSQVSYPPLRRLQSVLYQLLIRILFDVSVRDTQTGLKLLRRPVLAQVLPLLAVKRFAFDLELLVVAQHVGYRRIVEAPVELNFKFESTISPSAVFNILWDTAAIFYRLRILRYYDRRRREIASNQALGARAGSPRS
jgi:glycosyltransferase involved in cell wall biosynthesis